jgi:hypothetical protein
MSTDKSAAGVRLRRELREFRETEARRLDEIQRAFARSPAIRGGAGAQARMAIKSGELSDTKYGRYRVTFFGPDGPHGHITKDADRDIAEETKRVLEPPIVPMSDDEVMAWTSTEEFHRGAKLTAYIQGENTLRWLAGKAGRTEWAQGIIAHANDVGSRDGTVNVRNKPYAPDALDDAIEILSAAIRELPPPAVHNPPGGWWRKRPAPRDNPTWTPRTLTYSDFYRTGVQDCGNVLSLDDFDLRHGGSIKQIVDRTWGEWEEDGMMASWLAQQDDFEGLDPSRCYENWRAGWKACAVATLEEHIERTADANDNPPAGWWRKPSPKDQPCYQTKSEALARFLEVNYEIVENYGGADYEVSPSEFDSINHKYDLKGPKAVRTIADAVWVAMPVGKPYCLDRIDLDALNDTSPARESSVPFRLPDSIYESQLAAEEARYYASGHEEPPEPEWVTEHEPVHTFPPLPPVPYWLQLEKREPGVEVYKIKQEARPLGPLPSRDVKPMRLQLEEREPGVETYRMSNPSKLGHSEPIENPAWVTNILSRHYEALEESIPAMWLPKLTQAQGFRGKIVATMKELGCGSYGCAIPSLDPNVILKITTDDTEAQFAHELANNLSAPIVVKYHQAFSLPDKYKGRSVYLLWRDSAERIGEVDKVAHETRGADRREIEKAIHAQHKAAQKAFEALYTGEPAEELIEEWEVKAREMGQKVPELAELAEGMITVLHKDRVFMGDVHADNVGLVNERWVITDPGHVAKLL